MGGSSAAPVPAAPPPPPQPVVPVNTYQAYQPNQNGLLAEQMQAGYGGLLADYQNPGGIYQDMRVPVINRPEDIQQYLTAIENEKKRAAMASGAAPAPAPAPAPTAAVSGEIPGWGFGNSDR